MGDFLKEPKTKNALNINAFYFGWMMGLEPTTFGTTNRRSNQLNYNHRFQKCKYKDFCKINKQFRQNF